MDWCIACICMYFVCITPLIVEYNNHTYTYMTHTGICNLIHTAYRFSCICRYHIVSALYLFNAFVSACIYLLVYSCICMYVTWYLPVSACMNQISASGYARETPLKLSVRLPGCVWFCAAHWHIPIPVKLEWSKDFENKSKLHSQAQLEQH